MGDPSIYQLREANRRLAPFGIIAAVATLAWELIGKLCEHIILSWLAEHLKELPWVKAGAAWTLAHAIEVFLIDGVSYSLLVIARAKLAVQKHALPVRPVASSKLEVTARARKAVRKPHFAFLGLELPELYTSPDPRDGVRLPSTGAQQQNSDLGVTMRFINFAMEDGSSGRAVNVVARMRLYSADWNHSADIDYGVWLGSAAECTDMDVGDIRQLVLLVYGSDNSYFGLKDLRHLATFQPGEEYVRLVMASWIANVEVILTDQNSHVTKSWVFHVTPHARSCNHHETIPPPHAARMVR
jgi:hypothetical protein